MRVARGLGTIMMSTRNMVAELPVVRDVLSDDMEIIFEGEEGDNFFIWMLQHPHFIRKTSN